MEAQKCDPISPCLKVKRVCSYSKLLTTTMAAQLLGVLDIKVIQGGRSTPPRPKVKEFKHTSASSLEIGGLT